MACGQTSATDNRAIAQFRRGDLGGIALDVSIEAILGCRHRPDALMARARTLSTDPNLRRSCGTQLPFGSEILVRLADVIDADALLDTIEAGAFVGDGTVVTLFEAELGGDTAIVARGCGVL
jgi:hypothetical protein